MRVLGIDYGDRRIGIAVSDAFGWSARGLETIKVKDSIKPVLEKIANLCKEHDVKTVVIGYPKNMDGSKGFRVDKTEQFIDMLGEKIKDIEIVRWDERLTSVSALNMMKEMGIKTTQKGMVDKLAATIILQGYLDSIYNKKNS